VKRLDNPRLGSSEEVLPISVLEKRAIAAVKAQASARAASGSRWNTATWIELTAFAFKRSAAS
jgi:hypothetical protein